MALLGGRTREITFDLRASGFNELAVVHSGRAGRHAGHAAKAAIEVADPAGVDLRSALGGKLDQVDAAARRIHFLPPEDVGGTSGKAEAAMHALVDDFRCRRMVLVEGGARQVRRSGHRAV